MKYFLKKIIYDEKCSFVEQKNTREVRADEAPKVLVLDNEYGRSVYIAASDNA